MAEKTTRKLRKHELYVDQIRSKGRMATPYRIGLAAGAAGDNLPCPYVPGSRGERCFLRGLEYGRAERAINAKARALYEASIANEPVMHCNRFPSWDELAQKWPWREKAIEALAPSMSGKGDGNG
jgi:hypothetical protein